MKDMLVVLLWCAGIILILSAVIVGAFGIGFTTLLGGLAA